jgi:hypothetical protein
MINVNLDPSSPKNFFVAAAFGWHAFFPIRHAHTTG